MQNHHHHQQQVSTTKKPPRPPPLSDSHPSITDPETHTHSPGLPHAPPFRSDDPVTPSSPSSKNGGAIVAVEKYYSPLTSPFPITPPMDPTTSSNFPLSDSSQPQHHIVKYSRKEAAPPLSGVVLRGGGERKGIESKEEEEFVKKVGLGIRVLEIVFCLVSFSVMATDKTQGWSGDSFNRYKEYRFCLTVNIMGFVYSGFQAYDLAYHLATGKHVISHHLRYQFDFIMDQVVAYLLISASSAAASRVDDWQLNWGKDEFTQKAIASVSMSFLAFAAFAMSSLISGYNLCNRDLL